MQFAAIFDAFSSSFSITFMLLALSVILLFRKSKNKDGTKGKFPPGPRGIPCLGYLPFLGKKPYKTLKNLGEKYGGIFSIPIGNQVHVVLNSFSAVEEAYKKESFLGRPPNTARTNENYSNLADMDGQIWVDHAKFTKIAMRGIGMANNEVVVNLQQQLDKVFHSLDAELRDETKDVNPRRFLATAFDNMALSLLCSNTIEDTDEIAKVLQRFQLLLPRYFTHGAFTNSLPFWLRPLALAFNYKLKGLKETLLKTEEFFAKEIKTHLQSFDEANPNDFIDFYLKEIKSKKPNFDEKTLNGMLQIFLLASSETSRVTIEWSLLYLAKYQEIQEKVYQEIIRVLGTDKRVSMSDRNNLPNTWAFLYEVQRRKTIAPMALNRRVTEDTKLNGYGIPKDTTIMVNLWSIHMDENNFNDPKAFNPDRFLSENKDRAITPPCYIPFSYGPRKCPGDKMAEISMFIFLVSFVQKYRILPADAGVCLKSEFRTVTLPLCPTVKLISR